MNNSLGAWIPLIAITAICIVITAALIVIF